jgi:hypothetical protein
MTTTTAPQIDFRTVDGVGVRDRAEVFASVRLAEWRE